MKSLKVISFLGLILLTHFSATAQTNQAVDSLTLLLSKASKDIAQVDILNSLAEQYCTTDSLQTRFYTDRASDLAEALGYQEGIIKSRHVLGMVTMNKRNYPVAIGMFLEIVEDAESLGYLEGVIDAKNALSFAYYDLGRFDEAQQLADDVAPLHAEVDYPKGMAVNLMLKGILQVAYGDNISAMGYFDEVTNIIENSGDIFYIDLYRRKGVAFANQGDLRNALESFFQSIKLEERRNNKMALGGGYNNVGVVFYQQKDWPNALKYYQKALSVFKEIDDTRGVSTIENNIGLIFLELERYDSAEIYFQNAIATGRQIEFSSILGWAYAGMAKVSQEKGDYLEGRRWAEKSLAIRKELARDRNLAQTYNILGKNSYLEKSYRTAIKYYEAAAEICIEIGNALNYSTALEGISLCHEALGEFEKAYQSHVQFKAMSDSLINDSNVAQLTRVEDEFEFSQVRDSLNFAQQRERLVLEAEIDQQRQTTHLTVVALSVIFVLLFITFMFYRKVKISNHALQDANADLRRSKEEISKQRDELALLNKTKTRFFSIISHDVRGPMSRLFGYYELTKHHLMENYDVAKDATLQKMFSILVGASKQTQTLLDGLLSWALKEEGLVPYHPQQLSLKDCVDRNIEFFQHHAKAKKISVSAQFEDHIIWADKHCMMTIIRNLLGNSLKFTEENGNITFSAHELSDDFIQLEVIDNGIGISKEKQSRLFEINENGSSFGTGGEKGTGLGLNLVKDFVSLNQGEISVESVEGMGTTFSIKIPSRQLKSA